MKSSSGSKKVPSIFSRRNLSCNPPRIDISTFSAIKARKITTNEVVVSLQKVLPTMDLSQKETIKYLSYLARNKHSTRIALVATTFLLSKKVLSPKNLRLLLCIDCQIKPAVLIQMELLNHDNVSGNDLRYLSQWGRTLLIAMMSVTKLIERSHVQDDFKKLRSVFIEGGRYKIVQAMAEDAVLSHPDVLQKDKNLADYRKKNKT